MIACISGENMKAPRVVAVVDDDASFRKSIGRLLSIHGFGTEIFTSAEEFLNAAASSTAQCILLDIHLGRTSGIDLCRQLAAVGSAIPVIFMTALDDDATREQAIGAGCIAYLRKPFSANSLLEAIGKAAT